MGVVEKDDKRGKRVSMRLTFHSFPLSLSLSPLILSIRPVSSPEEGETNKDGAEDGEGRDGVQGPRIPDDPRHRHDHALLK